MAQERITVSDVKDRKNNGSPLVCLTSYTTPMAKILDKHCDILLVGDSLGMALYGMDNTLNVTLDTMINHGKAVTRAVEHACVVVDMPFGTYEQDPETAYKNALKIITETKCDAIKIEGGCDLAGTIKYLVQRNIPVMGHIGLLPQSVLKEGGYKVKGKTNEEVSQLIEDAKAVEEAGAFAMVIEGTIDDVARNITESINIPTIGIGASSACDGQVLVTEDMLGLTPGHVPKFVKKYVDISKYIEDAAAHYANDVKERSFPEKDHTYQLKDK